MKYLRSCHGTIMSYSTINKSIYFGNNYADYITYVINNDTISFKYSNYYIDLDSESESILQNQPIFYPIIYSADNKILITVNNLYLSATDDSRIQFQNHNQEWERFFIEDSDKINLLERSYKEYASKMLNQNLSLICCSGNISYGDKYFCTDLNNDITKNTYPLDITKPFPFSGNTFNFIFIEHGLEHVNLLNVKNFIAESYRILKKDGILRIASPSLSNWIKYYISDDQITKDITEHAYNTFLSNTVYPNIKSKAIVINSVMREWGHQLVLDYDTYKSILHSEGFADVYQCNIHQSNYSALNNLECRTDAYSMNETVVLEAKK